MSSAADREAFRLWLDYRLGRVGLSVEIRIARLCCESGRARAKPD